MNCEGIPKVREPLFPCQLGLGFGASDSLEGGQKSKSRASAESLGKFVRLISLSHLLSPPMEGDGGDDR